MITLTRLNGKRFVLNAEMIRLVEENPDTTIQLTTGERVIVLEPVGEVVTRATEYGRLLRGLVPKT